MATENYKTVSGKKKMILIQVKYGWSFSEKEKKNIGNRLNTIRNLLSE